jgi:hypothetical protein
MPVITEDRPIEKVREEVIDQLTMNYSHGEISLEAFERRLDQAMETDDHQKLLKLTEDLELDVDQQFIQQKQQELGTDHDIGEAKDLEYIVEIFSGSDRGGVWNVPKEIRMFSLFSGSDIDLSEAHFNHKTLRIKIFSLFSGTDIFVPENIKVVSNTFSIFGGVDNKAPSIASSNAPTVIIEGFAIFSGIDISFKQSFKEKLMNFAEGIKKLFV